MTTTQIKNKAIKEAKKVCSKVSEILNIEVKSGNTDGIVWVTMQSTCEANETMTWYFYFDYKEGNEDIFSDYEKLKYPELIEKPVFTFKQVD